MPVLCSLPALRANNQVFSSSDSRSARFEFNSRLCHQFWLSGTGLKVKACVWAESGPSCVTVPAIRLSSTVIPLSFFSFHIRICYLRFGIFVDVLNNRSTLVLSLLELICCSRDPIISLLTQWYQRFINYPNVSTVFHLFRMSFHLFLIRAREWNSFENGDEDLEFVLAVREGNFPQIKRYFPK